jgi:hypothetical protein
MKRVAILAGIAASFALLIACGGNSNSPKPPGEQDICSDTPSKNATGSGSGSSSNCPSNSTTTAKKDGGSSSPGTPTPGTNDAGAPPPADAGSANDSGIVIVPSTNPRDICVDTANIYAQAMQRCGYTFADSFQDFLDQNVNGDCANVHSVRDVNALYQQCLPWLKKATCNDVVSGNLPDSCLNQLQP